MYEQSESIDQITAALAAFHAYARNPAFDAKNPHFGNRYVTLANLTDGYREALAANGLTLDQWLVQADPGRIGIVTQLSHVSGQWRRSTCAFPVAGKGTAQDAGSAVSYARRYGFMAALNLAGDEDDDGNHASGRDSKPQAREKAPSKAQERLEAAKAARAKAEPSAPESAPSGPQGTCPDHGPFDGEGCPDCGLVEGEVAGDHATDQEVFALIDRMERIGMQKRQIAELLPGQPYHVEQDVFDLAVEAVQRAEKVAEKRSKLPSQPAEGGPSPAMQRLKEAQERRAAAKSRIRGQG